MSNFEGYPCEDPSIMAERLDMQYEEYINQQINEEFERHMEQEGRMFLIGGIINIVKSMVKRGS